MSYVKEIFLIWVFFDQIENENDDRNFCKRWQVQWQTIAEIASCSKIRNPEFGTQQIFTVAIRNPQLWNLKSKMFRIRNPLSSFPGFFSSLGGAQVKQKPWNEVGDPLFDRQTKYVFKGFWKEQSGGDWNLTLSLVKTLIFGKADVWNPAA